MRCAWRNRGRLGVFLAGLSTFLRRRRWVPASRFFGVFVGFLVCLAFIYVVDHYQYGEAVELGENSHLSTGLVAWVHLQGKSGLWHLEHVINVLLRTGFTVVHERPEKWDLFWTHQYPFRAFKELRNMNSTQRVNHFPGSGFVTNKVSLATLQSKYVPKAFELPAEKDEALAYAKKFPEKLFVQKSNLHRGISIQKMGDFNLSAGGRFVQEFVSDPFLIDGHKFDVGVYTVITSVDPLRVYVFEGDILFRFCPEKYHPFDPVNLDKYVVGDAYKPIWEVPSLKQYYTDLKLGMKESFNAYLRSKGRDPDSVWLNVKLAVQEIFLKKEPLIANLLGRYPFKYGFFELTRLDFILDSNLNPYLMEANMSPNLSSYHFRENRFIYEQVLFNLFSLVGLARKISSDTLGYRSDEEKRMEVSDKEISVFHPLCASSKCVSGCGDPECRSSCVHCYSEDEKEELKRAYKEHVNRVEFRRVVPMPMHRSQASNELESNPGLLPKNQWMLKWFRGMCLKDQSWCQ